MEKQDEADYRCKAKNLYGTAVSDYARLTVEAGAEIMESPDSSRVQLGEKVKENQGDHAVDNWACCSWSCSARPRGTRPPSSPGCGTASR